MRHQTVRYEWCQSGKHRTKMWLLLQSYFGAITQHPCIIHLIMASMYCQGEQNKGGEVTAIHYPHMGFFIWWKSSESDVFYCSNHCHHLQDYTLRGSQAARNNVCVYILERRNIEIEHSTHESAAQEHVGRFFISMPMTHFNSRLPLPTWYHANRK